MTKKKRVIEDLLGSLTLDDVTTVSIGKSKHVQLTAAASTRQRALKLLKARARSIKDSQSWALYAKNDDGNSRVIYADETADEQVILSVVNVEVPHCKLTLGDWQAAEAQELAGNSDDTRHRRWR